MDHLDETTIGMFLERRLPDDRSLAMQHHIDRCDECRRLVAELGRTSGLASGSSLPAPVVRAPSHARGDRVGRYVIIDLVGAGAMGAVYSAFDPDLDRKVAVKVLHAGAGATEDDRARLVREAQALARVSHPNVIAVHDVGRVGEHIFIAMELLAGGTFKTWLAERDRSTREIIATAVAAGRGLEAAHAVGLVHRDVKPDNVLVDHRGVARIGDFGLAAHTSAPQRPSDPVVAPTVAGDAALTAPGAIVGTPAYMAPELLAGAPATPRSDQFSFCAMAFEALYGVRPYAGSSVADIAAAMKRGVLAEPKRERRVPVRVRAAIVRGLATDADARFPSLTELLAALATERWSRRRMLALGLAGAAVIGGGALAATRLRDKPAACDTAAAEIARVWNPQRRAQVRAAIVATQLPFAPDSADRVERALDAYASAWSTAHTAACEATAVHRTQSPELLDRRMACLDQRRLALDAAIDSLATSNHDSVRNAVEIATRLPSLAICSDATRLTAIAPRPTDPVVLADIAAVERDIARARTLEHGAYTAQAIAVARDAAARAERIGYAPTVAAAYLALGDAQTTLGPPQATRAAYEQAVTAATRGGDEDTEARALAALAVLMRSDSPDGAIAATQIRQALAIVEKSLRDPLLEAEVHHAAIRVFSGTDHAATELHRKLARERLAAAATGGIDTRRVQLELDQIDAFLQIDPNISMTMLGASLHLAEDIYGPTHPQVAAVYGNLSHYALMADRFDEARSYAKRAGELLAPYPGNQLALRRIDAMLEPDAAKKRPILEEVVQLSLAAYGPTSPQVADDREDLGEALLDLEDYRAGLTQIDAAIATWEAVYGGHYEKMIISLVTKAQLHLGLHEYDAEAAAAERANQLVEHDHMRELTSMMPKMMLIDVYFRRQRFAEALAMIETVRPVLMQVAATDPEQYTLDFYAAACKYELDRDRPVALHAAQLAQAHYRAAGGPDKSSRAFMATWLAGK